MSSAGQASPTELLIEGVTAFACRQYVIHARGAGALGIQPGVNQLARLSIISSLTCSRRTSRLSTVSVCTRPRFIANAPTARRPIASAPIADAPRRTRRMRRRQDLEPDCAASVSALSRHCPSTVRPVERLPAQSARRPWCTSTLLDDLITFISVGLGEFPYGIDHQLRLVRLDSMCASCRDDVAHPPRPCPPTKGNEQKLGARASNARQP